MDKKKLIAFSIAVCLPCASLLAQVITGESFLREVESSFQNIAAIVLRVVSIAMGVAAGVMLFMATIGGAKRSEQNKEQLLQWFVSFAIGFLCLEIVRALIV